ncbi:MAG: aminoacetone oxidase family FAD-binding enzyme, partial [Oscillospiraceae bacterium]|nr:aminoacetone oxidase family FAD-binding enzyme [Candidatus Limimonas coprohippi]
TVLDDFDAVGALEFFNSLGLKIRDEEGRLYPYSMNASNVVALLKREATNLGVIIKTDCKVEMLDSDLTVNDKDKYDAVVLAVGGKAAPSQGTDGDGYKLLKNLGIKYHPITPALVQVKVQEDVKELKGVRFKGVLFLRDEDDDDTKPIKFQEGELLFTDYGISGIPAMQLSGDIAQMTARGEKPLLNICFTPDLGLSDINEYLENQVDSGKVGPEILFGILNEKLAKYIYEKNSGDLNHIALDIMSLEFTAIGTNGFKDAQVTRGGVGQDELNDFSLMTKKVPNLFITGELLNVDGTCGGFNLHFAWGSGIKAGKEVANLA